MIFFFGTTVDGPEVGRFPPGRGAVPRVNQNRLACLFKKKFFFVAMVDGTRPSGGANLRVFPGEPHPRWVRL